MLLCSSVFGIWLAFAVPTTTHAAHEKAAPLSTPAVSVPAAVPTAPNINLESDTPPPTAYDRLQSDNASPTLERGTWIRSLLQMMLGLAIVVGLIYVIAKVVLPKLPQVAGLKGGQRMRIVERVALDTKHTLYWVELQDHSTLILGTGSQGVQVLARKPGHVAPFKEAKELGLSEVTPEMLSDTEATLPGTSPTLHEGF